MVVLVVEGREEIRTGLFGCPPARSNGPWLALQALGGI